MWARGDAQNRLRRVSEAASDPFFAALHQLVESSEVVVDRPRGTAHPRIAEAIYPVDYGYLSGTTSADGEGIDVFLGTGDPSEVTAVILTADAMKRDAETKVLLGCAVEETAAVRRFIIEVLKIGGLLVTRS